MRWALILIAVLGGALTYFVGLRLGYVTLTSTLMYNAQGKSSYSFRQYEDGAPLTIRGSCVTRSGSVTLRLYDPTGTYLSGQQCTEGEYVVNLQAAGAAGFYRLLVEYDHFTGRLYLTEDVTVN